MNKKWYVEKRNEHFYTITHRTPKDAQSDFNCETIGPFVTFKKAQAKARSLILDCSDILKENFNEISRLKEEEFGDE